PDTPVDALCARAIAAEGEPEVARRLFEEAWALRSDDFEAAIAAHYLARHQPTVADELHWCARALAHAERLADGRAVDLLPSLLLNLGDAQRRAGDVAGARTAARRAQALLQHLPSGGYRDFVALGVERLLQRLEPAD
ncbi:MAG TPA: hypothetical protein VFV33_00700, partial [Gemmatimonadaceae bacterium]|nr:hypothetical protein [Gemmatimonadaceae bacterium]